MRRYRDQFDGSSAAKPAALHSVQHDIAAWLSMLCSDHGAVRLIYNNLFYLGDGMYRCSQPSPGQLRRYQRRYGIRTVINLRGRNPYGSYRLEVAACRRLGITLHDTKVLKSRSPPDEAAIGELHELFSSIEYPALMHCKSGADRAGLAAAMYRMLRLNHPVEQAARELHWLYGHFRQAKTGVLDRFLDAYRRHNEFRPMSFLDWATTVYNRREFWAENRDVGWADWLVNGLLKRE